MASPKGVPALRLVLPGAPTSWHTVVGFSGHFHPDKPTPLGGPGLPSVEDAKAFIAGHKKTVKEAAAGWEAFRAEAVESGRPDIGDFVVPDCPVEMTEVSEAEAESLRAELVGLYGEAIKAAYLAARAGEGELPHVESQVAAVAAGENQEG